MLTELTSLERTVSGACCEWRTARHPSRHRWRGSVAGPRVAADPLTRQAVEPAQMLDRASRAAARAMFTGSRRRDHQLPATRAPGGRSIG